MYDYTTLATSGLFLMDRKLFVANWKSHKTKDEAYAFFESLKNDISQIDISGKEIVIAPPFTLLPLSFEFVKNNSLPVSLAAQNVSAFPQGAYTGEINARQVKEFATYVIIGHSERKKYMHETENDIENKVREAREQGLTVIQCIQDENDKVHHDVEIVAYEPPSAIGTGNPDTPEHITEVFNVITQQNPSVRVLYGGSVDGNNVKSFLEIEKLGGFLVGGASLEAQSFMSLLSW